MAQPKTKTTKSRRNNRRSHHHASTNASGKCKNCGEIKMAHTICPNCGQYKNREVLKKEEL